MNDVSDVRTLSQRFLQCALNDKGVLPEDPKMYQALAGAIVCDLRVRQAIDVEGDTITAKEIRDNIDMPLAVAYDQIKMAGPISFEDLAKTFSAAQPERYNALITELCSPLADAGAMTATEPVNGLNAYLASPTIIEERISHMIDVVLRTRANDPYDQGLAILLDYVGLLDKLTDGRDQGREFQHRLHKEEGIDNAEGQALKVKPAAGLLSQMVAVAGETTTVL